MTPFIKNLCAMTGTVLFGLSTSIYAASVEGTHHKLFFKELPDSYQTIRLHGPDGILVEFSSEIYQSKTPLPEGVYRFEVLGEVTATPKVDHYKQSLNNGRDSSLKPKKNVLGRIEEGRFHIHAEKVLQQKNIKE